MPDRALPPAPDRARRPAHWLRRQLRVAAHGRRRAALAFGNWVRRLRAPVDYVVFPVGGPLPELSPPSRSFIERQLPLPPQPLSLETVIYNLELVQDDPRIRGAVLVMRNLRASLSAVHSLRLALRRLRQAGKRAIIFATQLGLAEYYAATAADLIVIPPGAEFDVLGLQINALYYRDALGRIGVQGEVVQISPYKAAGSAYSQQTMSPEERAQYDWLLDDNFDLLTAEMAAERPFSQDELKALINWAPFSAAEALRNNLIDAVGYEDELPRLIAEKWPVGADGRLPRLATMGRTARTLQRKVRREHDRYIGIIAVEGAITMEALTGMLPIPLPGEGPVAAEETITRQIRRAEQDDDLAALVVYINSPGGDALASDLIWRELTRLRQKRPVVAYLGSVAASGGYYVAAAADQIIAAPTTVTGSIGVIAGRVSVSGLYEKLHVNSVTLRRGNHAGLYRDLTPLSDTERALIWGRIVDAYSRFKQVVADGRKLPFDRLDPICEGRVWTGRQALAHGLIDGLGDLDAAIWLARELAHLPMDPDVEVPVRTYYGSGFYRIPEAAADGAPRPTPANALRDAWSETLWRGFPRPWAPAAALQLASGRPSYLLPLDLIIN